jgi:hypothetical protein
MRPDFGAPVRARSPRGLSVPNSRLPRELGGASDRREEDGELGGGAA